MKKLCVNTDACIGCGVCVATDPEHFDFDDDGYSEVISNENIESEACKNAKSSCPTGAIRYVENSCDNEKCHCDNCECDDCQCDGSDCNC